MVEADGTKNTTRHCKNHILIWPDQNDTDDTTNNQIITTGEVYYPIKDQEFKIFDQSSIQVNQNSYKGTSSMNFKIIWT